MVDDIKVGLLEKFMPPLYLEAAGKKKPPVDLGSAAKLCTGVDLVPAARLGAAPKLRPGVDLGPAERIGAANLCSSGGSSTNRCCAGVASFLPRAAVASFLPCAAAFAAFPPCAIVVVASPSFRARARAAMAFRSRAAVAAEAAESFPDAIAPLDFAVVGDWGLWVGI